MAVIISVAVKIFRGDEMFKSSKVSSHILQTSTFIILFILQFLNVSVLTFYTYTTLKCHIAYKKKTYAKIKTKMINTHNFV